MRTDDKMIRAYLQSAHDRGGSYHMAMLMMADRILVLEDRLLKARVEFPEDKTIPSMGEE
ncbi:hypothetical protein [Neorhizobium sp. DAR64872/K0K18]|uniref:hypothetical protein n=1 Tax=Neorhizobium sp. DAR64872/K0K18 TaxID=3421958 RepID=UPI003D295D7F